MACILSLSIQSQIKEVEIHKTYRRQMASRSAGPIDKRMLVSAFVISGPTLPSNSSKWPLLILKYCRNSLSSRRSSWTRTWYSPRCRRFRSIGCTQQRRTRRRLPRYNACTYATLATKPASILARVDRRTGLFCFVCPGRDIHVIGCWSRCSRKLPKLKTRPPPSGNARRRV